MEKRIAILGSTGSIGTQALNVIERSGFRCVALSCDTNSELLTEQIERFGVTNVYVADVDKRKLLNTLKLNSFDSLTSLVNYTEFDILLVAVSVSKDNFEQAYEATKFALVKGKTVAIATKELIVARGESLKQLEKQYGGKLIPVDSEHSAIFQCLQCADGNTIRTIYLTASGGALRDCSTEQLKTATYRDALAHPIWNMGKKVTVDSATLMNKSLEILEATRLFEVPIDKIKVLIHRESVIHSMVEFEDGAIIAQLGTPDMKLAIQYAFSYPERLSAPSERLSFDTVRNLSFDMPDTDRFPCLLTAQKTTDIGGAAPFVLICADDIAVKLFSNGKIGYFDIADIVNRSLDAVTPSISFDMPFGKIYGLVENYINDIL